MLGVANDADDDATQGLNDASDCAVSLTGDKSEIAAVSTGSRAPREELGRNCGADKRA